MLKTQVWPLGQEDPLKKGMATYSRILAWRIPWTEEPGRLQSMGSQRVRHDWANNTFSTVWWRKRQVVSLGFHIERAIPCLSPVQQPRGFPGGSVVKHLIAVQQTRVQLLSWEDTLEEEMATHSGILDWRIPCLVGYSPWGRKESDMTKHTWRAG